MRPAENIERLVKHMAFKADPEMDESLWTDITRADATCRPGEPAPEHSEIRRWIMRLSIRRIATAVLICVAIGAASVVAVSIGQYYYLGRDEGGHHFVSDDGQNVVTMSDEDVPDVEQAQSDLQEMKQLSEQGKRELIRVVENRANGQLERRLFIYAYQLSDGRTREMGEAAPDSAGAYALPDAQFDEMIRMKKAGPGADMGTYEEKVLGRIFVFKQQKYVLSDGTEILWSVGEPKGTAED